MDNWKIVNEAMTHSDQGKKCLCHVGHHIIPPQKIVGALLMH